MFTISLTDVSNMINSVGLCDYHLKLLIPSGVLTFSLSELCPSFSLNLQRERIHIIQSFLVT